MFRSTGPHYCPVCPPVMVGKDKQRVSDETRLILRVANYSGCGVDVAECENCKRNFQISYKVANIIEIKKGE